MYCDPPQARNPMDMYDQRGDLKKINKKARSYLT